MNNRPGGEAVIAVQERARIGGVEVSRQTVIAATDEGLVLKICDVYSTGFADFKFTEIIELHLNLTLFGLFSCKLVDQILQ